MTSVVVCFAAVLRLAVDPAHILTMLRLFQSLARHSTAHEGEHTPNRRCATFENLL